MRILQIVDGVNDQASGLSYSGVQLSKYLSLMGHSVVIFSTETKPGKLQNFSHHEDFRIRFSQVPWIGKVRFASGLSSALRRELPGVDLVHGHGLWAFHSMVGGTKARVSKKPYVISTHGMLNDQALKIGRLRKQIFWRAFQCRGVEEAACVHVTSESEYAQVRALGIRAPIAVIRNGVNLNSEDTPPSKGERRKLLFIGRLHPIKNLETLLESWAEVSGRYPEWDLLIAGPGDEGYVSRLKELARRHGDRNVRFEPPVFGDMKRIMIRSADAFVLPSFSENFGVVVAESLSEGTPVLCSRAAPWEGLITERCGYWINPDFDSFCKALDKLMSQPRGELAAMGARGRAWMEREFAWRGVAKDMAQMYGHIVFGSAPPACLRYD